MLRPTIRWVWPLVVWTVAVWGSRIRNIWADDELSTGGQIGRTVLALSLVIPGLAIGRLLWVHRHSGLTRRGGLAVFGFAAWTAGVWVVRGTQILVADHDAGFKVVHTVLALVSIGLAAVAVGRTPARDR